MLHSNKNGSETALALIIDRILTDLAQSKAIDRDIAARAIPGFEDNLAEARARLEEERGIVLMSSPKNPRKLFIANPDQMFRKKDNHRRGVAHKATRYAEFVGNIGKNPELSEEQRTVLEGDRMVAVRNATWAESAYLKRRRRRPEGLEE
jgi:hypothetical protein